MSILSLLGSPVGGAISNFITSGMYNRQMDQFQNNVVNPLNQTGINANANAGYGHTGNVVRGQMVDAARAQRLADSGFSQEAIARRGQQAFGTVNANLGQVTGNVGHQLQNAGSLFAQQAGGINTGYDQSYNRATGLVQNLYGQQRADANRQFNEEIAQTNANLASHGLGSGTISSSTTGATNMRRNDELRRIAAQEGQAQLGVEGQFGLGALAARQQLAGAQLGASQNAASLYGNTALNQYGQQIGIGNTMFGAQDQGLLNRLGIMGQGSQNVAAAQLGVLGQGNQYYGGPIVMPPQYMGPATIQPHG